jgi:hypothetical protein
MMAIWQFECMIIPSGNVIMNIFSEEILLWKAESLEAFRENIKKIFPLEESWSKDIEQYGKIDGTCIKFLHEKEMVEVLLRLDLRSLSRQNFEEIFGMVGEVDGQILYQEKLYHPDFNEIIKLVRESDAARFCENPEEYLGGLDTEL